MKITKVLYSIGLCLLVCLTVFLSAFSTADQTDLTRIIVKCLSRYEQLKEVTPKTKEMMDSWLPDRGVRSKYAILKSIAGMDILESATGIEVFREGPHQGQINYYSSKMGYYNPEFLNEVNRTLKTLFEDPEFKENAKILYESRFRKLLKTYYAAYQILHLKYNSQSVEFTRLKEIYLEAMHGNHSPGAFLREYDREVYHAMQDRGYDIAESNTALSFWLRRNIDGTDTQFLDLLKMVFNNLETIIENDTLHIRDLEDKDGLKHQIGVDKPFTGVAINRYPTGVKIYEANFVEGARREFRVWNRQGTMVEEVRFEDGIPYKMTWDYVGNLKVVQDHILKGNTWEMISHTNYSQDGRKIFLKEYENKQEIRETHWYPDGSIMEEKNYENNQRIWKIWDHNGNEIIRGEMQLIDTVDIKELVLKENMLYKTGTDKPFTGVMTFAGELDYGRGGKWRTIPGTSKSMATLVFGKFDGPYTIWHENNGSKKSERTLKTNPRGEINEDGIYTNWYKNGQKESERDKNRETRWYESGQIAYEKSNDGFTEWYENGQVRDKLIKGYNRTSLRNSWFENGEKQAKLVMFRGDVLRAKAWDEHGNVLEEVQPVTDDNRNKIKSFTENFITLLKKRNYRKLEELIMPFEKIYGVFAIMFREKEVSEAEIRSKSVEYDKSRLKFMRYFKDTFDKHEIGKIELIKYDLSILNADGSQENIKWPNSINYVPEPAKYSLAKIDVFFYRNNKLDHIRITLISIDNQWYLIPDY
ncbi:hypothetical protein [Lentiprolixibacter aurantiacus]|uniref:Antitoxin component YwqK of the YwqJK toxin-antitoxin module n=1 Tax=Lentiprolixibacter aurantiacus TaxID=2993939 RepID=A0AAE3MJJ1_9FLAO|nr:hypothetical protein [Lentiprolixibacter aurantiacus]MCX2718476.1 hypothetical protein [Lentiprolixibacter aurantiacus]